MEGWAKIPEGARYAGVKPRTFRNWLKQGLAHSRLPSGTILVRLSAIDEFLKRFEVNENAIEKMVDETMKGLKT